MKHALLARMLVHLLKKATPFFVLDTHAGRGLYDLSADAATRTGEWQGGVARLGAPLAADAEALIAPYRAALAAVRARHGADAYPGSPLLVREFLRAAIARSPSSCTRRTSTPLPQRSPGPAASRR